MAIDPRYPIGKFERPAAPREEDRHTWLHSLQAFPAQAQELAGGLSDEELAATYRSGGWTIRQLIHHLCDSHLNAQLRFRFALTEQAPTIKPYIEGLWAELPDANSAPVSASLTIFPGLHARWVTLLSSLDEAQWSRTFVHPETGPWTIHDALGMYAWHGAHHLAHIRLARGLAV